MSVTILPAVDAALVDGALLAAFAAERPQPATPERTRRLVSATPRQHATADARTPYADPPLARSFARVSASRVRYEIAALY